MKITRLLPRLRRSRGFSLVEVTIATGITAVALSTLLGLVPQGLNNIKQAGEVAAESRISSHLIGIVSQARWQDSNGADRLAPEFDRKRYFFDDQGVQIAETEAAARLAYVAEIRLPARDVNLPAHGAAVGAADPFDPYLRRVTVKMANVASTAFDFDRANPVAYRTQTTLIARTGR